MSKENFLKGAAILGIAGIITKILGAFYRIPLSNLITTEGLGYYQTAYPLYTLLIMVSTSGLPTAISKIISEKRSVEDHIGVERVFKTAFNLFLVIGIVFALVVGIFSKPIVEKFMGNANGYYSLLALVPALLFVPIMSAFRGYFQGRQEMAPTAVSQTVEQLFRVITGLPLAYLLLDRGLPQAAGGATFGASIGAIVGTIYIVIVYISKRNIRNEERLKSKIYEEEPTKQIIKNILKIAIPITIGAAIVPIINYIDSFMVVSTLRDMGHSESVANAMYGQFSGNAQTLINFPQVISLSLAMSLVPAISEAKYRNDEENVKKYTKTGIRWTLLIGLPSSIGLFVLSLPIINLLYFKNTVAEQVGSANMLQILSIGLIFLTLLQTLTAVLQGVGKPFEPVKNMIIAIAVKVALNFALLQIPSLNIKGAAIGTVAAYIVVALLSYRSVKKYTNVDVDMKNTMLKPLVAAIIMGVVAHFGYIILSGMISPKIATLLSILVAGCAYAIVLLLLKSLSEEDFEMLPKGKKIKELLDKFGLIRKS